VLLTKLEVKARIGVIEVVLPKGNIRVAREAVEREPSL
jgi:hypothetical protein